MNGTATKNDRTLDALTATYVKTFDACNKAAEEAQRAAREAILPDIAAIFAAVPDLRKIEVDGITPYFNDGDPCVHSQHDAKINGRDEYGDEDDDADTMPELDRATFDRVAAIIGGMDDALEAAFGTHWTLTFTRTADGIAWTRDDNTDHD